MFASPDLSY